MKKNTKILLVFLVVLLIGILFFSVFREEKNKKENEEKIIQFAEGITVIENNQEKIVKDENEKFELKIDKDWELSKTTNILNIIVEDNELNGEAQRSFFVSKGDLFEDNFKDEIEKWLELQNSVCPKCYSVEEYKNLDGLEVVVIRDNVAINDQKDILFIKNNFLYGISTVNLSMEEIKNIINDMKFLN